MTIATMKTADKRRMSWTRRRGVLAAGAIVLAMTATACGGGGGGQNNADAKNQTMVMAVGALPATLAVEDFSNGTRPYQSLQNSFLFNYDVDNCDTAPSAQKLKGQLAKSWTVSEDRKTITVELNDYKSQWGNQLTSADVIWSLERGRAVSPIVKFLSSKSIHLNATTPITAVSDSKFTFNLDSPTPLDLAMWTVPTFTILDSTEMKKHVSTEDPWAGKWLKQNSAGFGPWKVDSFEAGNQISFSPNPGYTGERGAVGRVILKQAAGSSDQSQLLQSGSVNYARNLTWSQFADLSKNPAVKVYQCAAISRDWLVLQQKDERLANVKVRQAISMALDRDALVKGAYAGFGKPAVDGFLPGVIPAGATVKPITEDLDSAKRLMAEAGYASGFELTLGYHAVQPGSQVEQLSILLQSQLKEIGIDLKLAPFATGNDLSQAQSKGNYQALIWSSSGAVPDAYFEAGLIQPGSPNNTWNYSNPAYTDLVNQMAAAVPGSQEYTDAVVKLANLNVDEIPVVQLVDTPNIFAMTASIKGAEKGFGTIPIQPQPAPFESIK